MKAVESGSRGKHACDRDAEPPCPLPTLQFFSSMALKYESRSASAEGDPGGGVVESPLPPKGLLCFTGDERLDIFVWLLLWCNCLCGCAASFRETKFVGGVASFMYAPAPTRPTSWAKILSRWLCSLVSVFGERGRGFGKRRRRCWVLDGNLRVFLFYKKIERGTCAGRNNRHRQGEGGGFAVQYVERVDARRRRTSFVRVLLSDRCTRASVAEEAALTHVRCA